jgi:hypothetical protein
VIGEIERKKEVELVKEEERRGERQTARENKYYRDLACYQ